MTVKFSLGANLAAVMSQAWGLAGVSVKCDFVNYRFGDKRCDIPGRSPSIILKLRTVHPTERRWPV